ncbi:MAG: 1,4-dihydroxy-2-naphthoate polyprenyltransferase [Actinomycetota bacterium]|nr:1,4-dihydroxy-2-naphthoate polyprenyltransferase [Actinomycetota bacterium]
MATVRDWIEGARPRTLPAALAPVLAGTGAAAYDGGAVWWKAALALVVSLALQVGVNYANDYSDGVRGTDDERVGPLRLVGSGTAAPAAVKRAAFGCFGIGAVAGLALAATSGWWLLAVGAVAIVAAWGYTGGEAPYGYRALGEVSVFVFFGLVAVLGTTYVQLGSVNVEAILAGVGIGALTCAILVANNLRDIRTDVVAGKRTLAVVLGDSRSRRLYLGLYLVALLCLLGLTVLTPWTALGAVGLLLGAGSVERVRRGAAGADLVPVLRDTGLADLVYAIGITVGLFLAA